MALPRPPRDSSPRSRRIPLAINNCHKERLHPPQRPRPPRRPPPPSPTLDPELQPRPYSPVAAAPSTTRPRC
eukprot:11228328-Lingulodinium_polyedra.AAC.3